MLVWQHLQVFMVYCNSALGPPRGEKLMMRDKSFFPVMKMFTYVSIISRYGMRRPGNLLELSPSSDYGRYQGHKVLSTPKEFTLPNRPREVTSILGGRGGGAWTSHQVWRQNLGQGPAKFTK